MSSEITYALVIGVENYNDNKSFKRVRNAVKDATDFANALLGLGVDTANIKLLTDGSATKTSIDKAVADIVRDVSEVDRIIFYFSGHGAFEGGSNFLLPVDCFNDALPTTSIEINKVLGLFTQYPSTKNLMFLDCCHSGLNPGTEEKHGAKDFLVDELKYAAREEEYTLIFASCKSHQTSFTHPTLPNSVWTHFLLMALKGDAPKLYEHGLLYYDDLHTYLNKETDQFIQLNTDHGKRQQPTMYGTVSDRFIIGDLNPILNAKAEAEASKAFSFTNISMLSIDSGGIKELPGFIKSFRGGHSVPKWISSKTLQFVRDIGHPIIDEEINDLAKAIRSKLRYKLSATRVLSEDGSGSISNPDFTYSMEIFQSEENPGEYILVRKLENIQSSAILQNKDFNEIFSSYFQKLEFTLDNELDLKKFINKVEDAEHDNLIIDYDDTKLTQCEITIEGLDTQIIVTPTTLAISNFYKTDPLTLIQTYTEARKALLGYSDLGLIN